MDKMTLSALRNIFLGIVCTLGTFLSSSSLAADSYSQGCQSYSKGDYQTALSFFLKATAAYPTSPAVHYQLANTYLQLHRRAEAKQEYSRCLSNNPDAKTAEYCRKMVNYLGGGQPTQATSATGAGLKQPSKPGSSSADSPTTKAALERERRKAEIVSKAEADANAIKDEAKRQIKELEENSQQVIRDPQTGLPTTGIPPAQSKAIMDEAEERANRIIQQAKDRAAHM